MFRTSEALSALKVRVKVRVDDKKYEGNREYETYKPNAPMMIP
jgi:hypothetical protein